MQGAAELAAADLRTEGIDVALVSASGAHPVQNPHQDEGSDNDGDVAAGPEQIRALRERGIRIVVGPLRSNVALADEAALAASAAIAITGTAGAPSETGSHVYKVGPSERQLAAAMRAFMLRRFGPRICVLDDGTRKARREAGVLLRESPRARQATLGDDRAIAACVRAADGVYATALAARPISLSARTANRAGAARLLNALALRSFDPSAFTASGGLWRAESAPIARTPGLDALSLRYHKTAFVRADDDALRTYAAVQIAVAAARLAAGGTPLDRAMRGPVFRTVAGTVRFNDRGERAQPRIEVRRID